MRTKATRFFTLAALVAALIGAPALLLGPTPEAQAVSTTPPGYNPTRAATTEAFMQVRALSKIGSAIGGPQNVAWFFDDFIGNQNSTALPAFWNTSNTGSATDALQSLNDEGGGVVQVTTGATANSRADRLMNSPMVRNPQTTAWYLAFRQKITTAVTAQTRIYTGILDASVGSINIAAGFFGSLSAANFVVQYDGGETGSFVDLAVAVDTAYHTFEMWGGTGDNKLHCSIDLSSVDKCNVTLLAAPTISMSGRREAFNGTDAVARTVRHDWFAIMAKRN